jgi:hypothetical protein
LVEGSASDLAGHGDSPGIQTGLVSQGLSLWDARTVRLCLAATNGSGATKWLLPHLAGGPAALSDCVANSTDLKRTKCRTRVTAESGFLRRTRDGRRCHADPSRKRLDIFLAGFPQNLMGIGRVSCFHL